MIRIDAIWFATEPMDMRAGTYEPSRIENLASWGRPCMCGGWQVTAIPTATALSLCCVCVFRRDGQWMLWIVTLLFCDIRIMRVRIYYPYRSRS